MPTNYEATANSPNWNTVDLRSVKTGEVTTESHDKRTGLSRPARVAACCTACVAILAPTGKSRFLGRDHVNLMSLESLKGNRSNYEGILRPSVETSMHSGKSDTEDIGLSDLGWSKFS
jgi:hypothetical protein